MGDRSGAVRIASTLNILLGLWLFVSPSVYDASGCANTWNSWIAGIVIAAAAVIRLNSRTSGANWVNIVLGAWVFSSPWIYGYAGNNGRLINSIFVGVAVVALAAISHHGPQQQTAISH